MSSISILAYIVLTLSIGYAFIYSPMGDLTALMDQKQQYNDSLVTVSNIENTKKELLTKFDSISTEEKKDIDTVLPNSFDFVRLVSQIDAVASKYGISISKITSTDTSSSAGQPIDDTQPAKPYESGVIGFSFDASYDKFNEFMNELEKSMRVLDIKSVKLNSKNIGTSANPNTITGVYSYDVEFQTYWLKSS